MNVEPLALPMNEAIRFWKDKIVLKPDQYAELADEAKLKAFSVAGVANENHLTSIFEALHKALAEGKTFGQFKEEIREIIEKKGWTGKKAWRVNNIFRTNTQMSYSVGRYCQMKDAGRPYAQYDAVMDSRTRPTHAALDGKVFPLDHEFWDAWWPPNGFMCRCGTVSLSDRQVKSRGITVETNNPSGKLIEPIDPTTGQKMPARLLMPDRGFDNHPGKGQWGYESIRQGMGGWESFPGLKEPGDFNRPHLSSVSLGSLPELDKTKLLPSGQSDSFYLAEFQKLFGQGKIVKDAIGKPVVINLRPFLLDKTPGAPPIWKFSKSGHGTVIPLLEEMVTNPYEIWLTPQKHPGSGAVRLARRYVSLWKDPNDRVAGVFFFETVEGQIQGVTAFMPFKRSKPAINYVNGNRRGVLLYGR